MPFYFGIIEQLNTITWINVPSIYVYYNGVGLLNAWVYFTHINDMT